MLVYWLLFYLTKLEIYSTKSRLRRGFGSKPTVAYIFNIVY
jgi:hypothetical protein